MARSKVIYVITRPNPDDPVVAAFTVKHECATFIRLYSFPDKADWKVRRCLDGQLAFRPLEPTTIITFPANA